MKGKRILIGDDEKHILKVLENRLVKAGYVVIKAARGDEALAKAREEKPDLLILDLNMPGINGFQVCRALRKDPGMKNIPIIVLSAWVREKTGEEDMLADLYVTKPFLAEDLLARVRWLLEKDS